MKKELVHLNIRIPKTLREVMEKCVQWNLHTNISEFTRAALREKIQREAPHLTAQLLEVVNNE